MATATSKLQLLIEMPINKLRNSLNQARANVLRSSSSMQNALNGIRLPNLGINRLRSGLSAAGASYRNFTDNARNRIVGLATTHREAISAMLDEMPKVKAVLAVLANPIVAIAAGIGSAIAGIGLLVKHLFDTSKEIGDNQRIIRTTFGATGEELDKLTAKAMATNTVFGTGIEEFSRAGNVLYKSYKDAGLSAAGAADMVTKAIAASNNMLDLDNVNEYASKFREMGFAAEEFMSILAQQPSLGVFGDKLPDAIKEMGIELHNMGKSGEDALGDLGISAKKLQKQLRTGLISDKDALKIISEKLKNADIQVKQKVVSAIFKSAGEDLGVANILKITDSLGVSLDELIAKGGPAVAHLMKMKELNEQMVAKQEEYAPLFNDMRDKLEILSMEAKIWFYDRVAEGILFIKEYKEEFKAAFATAKKWIEDIGESFLIAANVIAGSIRWVSTVWGVLKTGLTADIANIKANLVDMGREWLLSIQQAANAIGAIFTKISRGWEAFKSGGLVAGVSAFSEEITNPATSMLNDLRANRTQRNNQYEAGRLQREQTLKTNDDLFSKMWQAQDFWGTRKTVKEAKAAEKSPKESMYGGGGGGGHTSFNGKDAKEGKGKGAGKGVSDIAGQSQQVRNITINFDSYIKGDVLTQNNTFKNMDQAQLTRWLQENFQRLIYSTEVY